MQDAERGTVDAFQLTRALGNRRCATAAEAGAKRSLGAHASAGARCFQLSRRSLIVQFIDHLRDDFCLDPEVTTFAVSYLDRFLCNVASRGGFEQHRTELLGLVCLMLASKFKEVMSPSIDGLLQSVRTKYTREDFKAMEVLPPPLRRG